ncbi:F0F1 ATP synthase subunit epsilon [Abyssisolibacter fermentans]|uniref:F0F1 ATP synthase subunit epsilon n=1 Tax=Abyssisolibacter fermentans TaxID=1766203 RepID=UPI00083402DF|nr:F0F1 ATP synthase subunit epsilon [Abyssisolibacter fermentans]
MASKFRLEIVTPDKKFFEDDVEMIIVRGTEGDIGILKNHVPLVTVLGIGKIKVQIDGEMREASIASGYIEVEKEKTTIITDAAEWAQDIDVKRAEAAKIRAEERLKKENKDTDVARAEIALKKAINRIRIAE